jgi:hypothetical protein
MANTIERSVTLKKDVRLFMRTGPRSSLLYPCGRWIRAGDTITINEVETMVFDHRDQTVVRVLLTPIEYFIIERELEEDPWHLRLPPSTPSERSYL